MPNLSFYNKDGTTLLHTGMAGSSSYLSDILSESWNTYGITEVSYSIGGNPISSNTRIIDLTGYTLYDVTEPETITGFFLDGQEYKIGGVEYNAGEGISIGDATINARKGPSPYGFHVPSLSEWQGLKTIMDGLSLTTGNGWKINLHMPFAGFRKCSDASNISQGGEGHYWSSSPYSANSNYARNLDLYAFTVYADASSKRANGFYVRCFKDSYVAPDSSWTVVQGTLGNAGIFWNQSEGLISITDGTTGYTMMDKNLGATTVYNEGETLTQANMGNMYQWGNNYGFPSTGTISNTSSTQVDASSYGPTNPYSSDTFITGNDDWSSVHNDDLWGDTTGTITQKNVISNTGVLSVNGQTGNVTITESNVLVVTQAEYDALPAATKNDGKLRIISDAPQIEIPVPDDTAFGSSWDGDTTHAPSKNAVYDAIGNIETLLAAL